MLEFSFADVRASILHAVGDATAYRISIPAGNILPKVQSCLSILSAGTCTEAETYHDALVEYSHKHGFNPHYILALCVEMEDIPYMGIVVDAHKWKLNPKHILARSREIDAFFYPLDLREESQKWGLDPVAVAQRSRSIHPYFHKLGMDQYTPVIQAAIARLIEEGDLQERVIGSLSLTRQSIAEAVSIRPCFEDTSVTHAWVTSTITPEYLSHLYSNLQSRCRKSAIFGEIEEIVHSYLASILRRNGLQKKLSLGQSPAPSSIKAWIYNHALSQFRDGGRDALTRGMKGCRTEKDLSLAHEGLKEVHQDTVDRSTPTNAQGVFLAAGDDGKIGTLLSHGSENAPLLDMAGGDLSDEIIHHMTAQQGLARIQGYFKNNESESAERLKRVFRQLVEEDANLREIAQAEGVSRTRAASLVSSIRAIAHGGEIPAAIRTASFTPIEIRVLSYIKEWPRTTLKDIREPKDMVDGENVGGMGEKVSKAVLDRLVHNGWLTKSKTGRFYIPEDRVAQIFTSSGAAASV